VKAEKLKEDSGQKQRVREWMRYKKQEKIKQYLTGAIGLPDPSN